MEVNDGQLEHKVAIKTDRKAFNRLFTEKYTPKLIEIGTVKGDKKSISRFDKAIDQTFYPIRLGIQ